jgi:type VII secretion integral membrane protein EccD
MAGGLSRVTIVSPHSRVDLALPTNVPLVDVLPTVLDLAGGATDEPARRTGWVLARLGGPDLDNSRTPAQLSVRDGELLYLRPRGGDAPAMVFDDLVDAVATGTREQTRRWTPHSTRVAALVGGIVALLGGIVGLPLTGPPYAGSGGAGLLVGAAVLAVAVVLTRALGESRIGTAFALLSIGYAAVGGLLVLAGGRPLHELGMPQVTVAVTATLLAAAVAAVGVPSAAPSLLGVAMCALGVLAGAGIATGLHARVSAAAAVIIVLSYALLPAMPMLSYRLVGLPTPTVPTEREQLRQETESVDGPKVFRLTRRADAYLSALLGALALISAAGVVVVTPAGTPGLALGAVLGVLPLLRSRSFGARSQRLPLLLSGTAALAATAVAGFRELPSGQRLLALVAVAVGVSALSIGFGLTGGRQQSPRTARLLDLLETLLILAMPVLAIWVSGILGWVRTLRG